MIMSDIEKIPETKFGFTNPKQKISKFGNMKLKSYIYWHGLKELYPEKKINTLLIGVTPNQLQMSINEKINVKEYMKYVG